MHHTPLVLAKHVHGAGLIDGLRVDGIQRPGDILDRADCSGDGRVPAVVILRRETGDDDTPAVEALREALVTEQFGQGESVPLDPVLGREVDGREGGQAAVRGAGGDEVVARVVDGTGVGFQAPREEVVEGGVFGRIRLDLDNVSSATALEDAI